MRGELSPGPLIGGDFEIERRLSGGGMGEVYVARQRSTGALRALKRLHAHLVADPVMRARFEREAKVVARIESQHVVQVLAAGVDEARGEPFIAMERQRITDLIVATGGLDRFTGRRATGLWHVEFDERGTMADCSHDNVRAAVAYCIGDRSELRSLRGARWLTPDRVQVSFRYREP